MINKTNNNCNVQERNTHNDTIQHKVIQDFKNFYPVGFLKTITIVITNFKIV